MTPIMDHEKRIIKSRLHKKFMTSIILLECLIMLAVILVVEQQMRKSILDEFLLRAVSIGKNLAAMNTNLLATYNYVAIEQNVENISHENDILYTVIQLFDGELVAYHERDHSRNHQGLLDGPVAEKALKSEDTLVQYTTSEGDDHEICDIAVPVMVQGEKWGTVRIGFALENIQAAILKIRSLLFSLGAVALSLGCLASIYLARRISRPIGALVKSVEAIAQGNYEHEIQITTSDEIGYLGSRFTVMQRALRDNIQLLTDTNHKLTETNHRLQNLFQASQSLNSLHNQDKLYDLILEAAIIATDAFRGSLALFENQDLNIIVAHLEKGFKSLEERSREHEFPPQGQEDCFELPLAELDSNVRHCLLSMEPSQQKVPFFTTHTDSHPELEIICIPLRQSKRLIGSINLTRRKKGDKIDDSEMQTLSVLASHATASMESRSLFLQLEEAYLSSIRSLAKTLEFKDDYTHGHSERVADLCLRIGKRMQLNEDSLKVLYNAALLHDIGKIGVMESILNKNSKLNDDEWHKIKRHPEFGEEILAPISSLREERLLVRHHHEREDGKGYPDGIGGDKLSLAEKIIIVADSFDAMNSKRAYRNPLEPEVIIAELQKNKGTQFNPEVVDVCIEIFQEELHTQALSRAVESSKIILFPEVRHSQC